MLYFTTNVLSNYNFFQLDASILSISMCPLNSLLNSLQFFPATNTLEQSLTTMNALTNGLKSPYLFINIGQNTLDGHLGTTKVPLVFSKTNFLTT